MRRSGGPTDATGEGRPGHGPAPVARGAARVAGHRHGRPPAPASALARRFEIHLRRSRLISPGQTVVVAVSGGVDSITLLHLLRFLDPAWNLRLVVAHLDHAMRPGSTADADWVAGVCRAWGVPFEGARAEPPPWGQAEAREARYAFLLEVRRRVGADRIATAHHADDQAETVLFRIARGAGLEGLRGIPPRRGPIVRPLLPFRRAEIEAYAAAVGLRAREDPTNRELGYVRNRLRHEVLPRLEAIVPGAGASLARLADHARAAERAWNALLEPLENAVVLARSADEIELARPVLLTYDPPIRARVLRRLLAELGAAPGRGGTRAAVEFTNSGASGTGIRVAGGVRIERDFDTIRILKAPPERGRADRDRPAVVAAPVPGRAGAVIGGRHYDVRWDVGRGPPPDGGAAFGVRNLEFPLVLREWRDGDRIRLTYGTKKLKKLFGERRLRRGERHRVPVLVDAEGTILWVPGIARAAVAPPDPEQPNILITVTNAEHA